MYSVPTNFVDLAQTCQVMAAVHELLFGADSPLTEMLTEWFLYITGGNGNAGNTVGQLQSKVTADPTMACRLAWLIEKRRQQFLLSCLTADDEGGIDHRALDFHDVRQHIKDNDFQFEACDFLLEKLPGVERRKTHRRRSQSRILRSGRGDGEGDETATRGAREPRTIVEAYKETYRTLLRFCDVSDPSNVAPVWSRLANCRKSEHQHHTVLTQELQRVCMARGLASELYTPMITTTLKQMVVGFQFAGFGADDLSSGCQPFLVAYAGSANHYAAAAAVSVGIQLSQGEQNAMLSDYRSIREKEKVKFPRDITEVCITLTRFAVLCQCLFQGPGMTRPFVDAMWTTAVSLQNIALFVTERFHGLARQPAIARTYYARIVRAIQISVHNYMHHVAENLADGVIEVVVPNFAAMMQDLKRGTFHHTMNWVEIPEQYLDPVAMAPLASVSGGTGGAPCLHKLHPARAFRHLLPASPPHRPPASLASRMQPMTPRSRGSQFERAAHVTSCVSTAHPQMTPATSSVSHGGFGEGAPPTAGAVPPVPFASAAERTRLLTYVRERLQAPAT